MKIQEIGEELSSLCFIDRAVALIQKLIVAKRNMVDASRIFQKKYTDFLTFSEDDGSPVYRRRSPTMGGGSSKVRMKLNRKWVTYEYTSKDVVPHNLWLLEKFDCHINVEIC